MPTGCAVFLVAETPGMTACVAEGTKSKAETIATALNSLLKQLADTPDLDVAIVGYRGDEHGGVDVGCRWGGPLEGRMFVPTGELAGNVLTVEQRMRKVPAPGGIGVVDEQPVEFPVWYVPAPAGPASPAAGYEYCQALLSSRLADRKPPLLVSLVDEVPEDGSLSAAVWELYGLELPAGPPMVYHVHLGSSARVPAVLCPSADTHLPTGAVRELFGCTSFLAEPLAAGLRGAGLSVNEAARGMIYHATMADLIRFLGTVKSYARFQPPAVPAKPQAAGAEPIAAPQQSTEVPRQSIVSPQQAPESPHQAHAALLLLLLDRSVEDPGADESRRVWEKLQGHVNDLLGQVSKRAGGSLHVGVVSYGTDAAGQPDVQIGLPGALADRSVVADTDLAGNEIRTEESTEKVSNGIGGLVEVTRKRPIFFDGEPTAADAAALRTGVEAAGAVIAEWRDRHAGTAAPPVVLHLTRGCWEVEALDRALAPLESLAEPTQGVLLYHLVTTESPHRSLAYPDSPEHIGQPELARLWEKSSPLPGAERLAAANRRVTPGSRGIVINGKFDVLPEIIAGAMPGA